MELNEILEKLQSGEFSVAEAEEKIKYKPYDDLKYATVDHHRKIRNGAPEIIYGEGKSIPQLVGIVKNMLKNGSNILVTRADESKYNAVKEICADAVYNSDAKVITIMQEALTMSAGKILVVTGGTSDIPVSEEAALTAEFLGNQVERLYDVGVAGLHRLLSRLDKISEATVIIVVAGMEGALASVVGGLTDKPVIAVPTSVGYGANFGGLSSLLCMLNSCASGVGVVNIDNGFGAGYLASSINKLYKG